MCEDNCEEDMITGVFLNLKMMLKRGNFKGFI